MSRDGQTRIALSTFTRDDVETAAWVTNFFIDHRTDASDDQPREDVWRTRDEATWLHEIEDHITGLRYLVLRGDDRDSFAGKLADEVKVVTYDDALDQLEAADSREEKAEALYQVGIASPQKADDRGLKALTSVLEDDEDHKLRQAALMAIAYTEWPEFKAAVQRAHDDDSSSTVRSTAEGILKAYG